MYRATRDPFYLDVGERVLFDLITRAKVDCGLTGIQDLRTNKRDDRMESFALSETLKYLFLLFDEENPLHSDGSNYVFSTEGHILTLGKEYIRPISPARRKMRNIDNHQCPVYKPFIRIYDNYEEGTGLVQGVQSRPDMDYARHLVGLLPTQADIDTWSPDGWCEKPKVDIFSYDFILSPNGRSVPEDLSPSLLKLGVLPDGYIIQNASGIRTHIVRRLDGKGYDIRKLGHYIIRPGHLVYINDSSLFTPPVTGNESDKYRVPNIQLRFYMDVADSVFQLQTDTHDMFQMSNDMHALVMGYTAHFGGDLSPASDLKNKPLRFIRKEGVLVHREWSNVQGCEPYKLMYPDSVLVAHRGGCTFLEKLLHARSASAAGVLVISDDDVVINPTADAQELEAAGDPHDVAIVLLPHKEGQVLMGMMDRVERLGSNKISMVLDYDSWPTIPDPERRKDPDRILYLNEHPLLNTRLLV